MENTQSTSGSSALLKVGCHELVIGMYISELDQPWANTPFPVGGFHVKKVNHIETLQRICRYVLIDVNRGKRPKRQRRAELTVLSGARKNSPIATEMKIDRDAYPITSTTKQEIDNVVRLYANLNLELEQTYSRARAGEGLELGKLDQPITEAIECLVRNPAAFIWYLNTDPTQALKTSYCVRAAIWSALLARNVGLPEAEIKILFLGTLIADIGLSLLPERLVEKRKFFKKKDFIAYSKHTQFSLEILGEEKDVDSKIVAIARGHHERHDGNGFPRKLNGEQIPVLAKFANIGYSFERLLHCDSGKKMRSPSTAISRLYKQRKLKFSEQLVVEFIHALGMYPAGSVVELGSGELALVLEQSENEKLAPCVALVTNSSKKVLSRVKHLDLSSLDQYSDRRSIVKIVDPNQFGIDPRIYALKMFGRRIGIGSLSIRL